MSREGITKFQFPHRIRYLLILNSLFVLANVAVGIFFTYATSKFYSVDSLDALAQTLAADEQDEENPTSTFEGLEYLRGSWSLT